MFKYTLLYTIKYEKIADSFNSDVNLNEFCKRTVRQHNS